MGCHFWTNIAAWTFLCSLWMLVFSEDATLLEDLGLDSLPDVAKINISQDEYTRMMNVYLERLQATSDPDTIPKLLTFNSGEIEHPMHCIKVEFHCTAPHNFYALLQEVCERKIWRRKGHDATRIRFPIRSMDTFDVENAELRLLAPPLPGQNSVMIQVYQVLTPGRRRFIEERRVYVSSVLPKWCEFDVTKATEDWLRGKRNLGLELECAECVGSWKPLKAALSALVHPKSSRHKRSSGFRFSQRRSDCREGDTKKRCCRHQMHVNFKDLKVFQIGQIFEPKSYEAGFCKGRCPPNYNIATNHSRIQSLVHKMDKTATPRVCCAPSKLESLEILRVDPFDNTKLMVEKWDNMKVLECACS